MSMDPQEATIFDCPNPPVLIEAEHARIALEALEFQHREFEERLRRQPRTCNGVVNHMRLHLLQCVNSIIAAKVAIGPQVEDLP